MKQTVTRVMLAASLAFGALTLVSDGAFAMPAMGDGASAAKVATAPVEQARWVCGPYRCWWRPGPGWGRPGWRWRRWHRW